MNIPENLLTRWSRRKSAAAEEEEANSPAVSSLEASGEAAGTEGAAAAGPPDGDAPALPGVPPNPVGPSFDPTSVPPIESIAAGTDIRAFLAPGVPPELTRAALRRAWTADPNIRDFVGPADYDWDFNAPGSMAGFGLLEMTDELCRVAAQIIGPAPGQNQAAGILKQACAETISGQPLGEPDLRGQRPRADEDDRVGLAQNVPTEQPAERHGHHDLTHPVQQGGAVQGQPRALEKSQLIVRHSRGGALPK
jgi:hypothetical protein